LRASNRTACGSSKRLASATAYRDRRTVSTRHAGGPRTRQSSNRPHAVASIGLARTGRANGFADPSGGFGGPSTRTSDVPMGAQIVHRRPYLEGGAHGVSGRPWCARQPAARNSSVGSEALVVGTTSLTGATGPSGLSIAAQPHCGGCLTVSSRESMTLVNAGSACPRRRFGPGSRTSASGWCSACAQRA
jgi:hypothetical protein